MTSAPHPRLTHPGLAVLGVAYFLTTFLFASANVAVPEVARRLFAGERGPVRDAVVLNAGAAVGLAQQGDEQPGDPVAAIREGMDTVEAVLDSGRAAEQLQRWVSATRPEGQGA